MGPSSLQHGPQQSPPPCHHPIPIRSPPTYNGSHHGPSPASSLNDFIAGAVSGGLGVLAGSPLDVVKVRLQVAASSRPASNTLSPPTARPAATWTLVRSLVQHEGFASLFRGAASPVLSVAAMNSLLFVSYSNSLRWLQEQRPTRVSFESEASEVVGGGSSRSLVNVSIAGLFAGFACFLISTPTELVKCRAQIVRTASVISTPNVAATAAAFPTVPSASTAPFRLVWHPISSWSPRVWTLPPHNSLAVTLRVLRNRGPLGFYRGGLVTLARDGPGYAVYFLVYEGLKQLLGSDRMGQFWAGGMAGVVSWASIYPLDVIKSRIQVSDPLIGVGAAREVRDVTREMWVKEGTRVFVRGMRPTLIRAFYVNAITFMAYEKCMEMLEARSSRVVE